MAEFLDVDPRTLHVPGSRLFGADPYKLQRQIARYGSSTAGMPTLEVTRGKDDELMISSGVTRATRVATLLPGQPVRVEVIDKRPDWDMGKLPTIGDLIP